VSPDSRRRAGILLFVKSCHCPLSILHLGIACALQTSALHQCAGVVNLVACPPHVCISCSGGWDWGGNGGLCVPRLFVLRFLQLVLPPSGNELDFDQSTVPRLWATWLSGGRVHPPTPDELAAEVDRVSEMAVKVQELEAKERSLDALTDAASGETYLNHASAKEFSSPTSSSKPGTGAGGVFRSVYARPPISTSAEHSPSTRLEHLLVENYFGGSRLSVKRAVVCPCFVNT
jgi:hypothetical protein